jgi:hypothetical protein
MAIPVAHRFLPFVLSSKTAELSHDHRARATTVTASLASS